MNWEIIRETIRNRRDETLRRKEMAQQKKDSFKLPSCRYFPNECGTYKVTNWNLGSDSEIYCVEFEMALTYRDWCEFQNTNAYLELIQFLSRLKKPNNQKQLPEIEDISES